MSTRLFLVSLLTFSGALRPVGTAGDAGIAGDTVSVATIREVTMALTQPEMEGRGTGQPGGTRAAEYLGRRFARAGAEPLGEAGFLQAVPLTRRAIDSTSTVLLNEAPLRFAVDYLLFPPLSESYPAVSGPVAFVGWGAVSQSLGRDDLAGVDLQGRVVFLLNGGRPVGVDQAAWDAAANRDVVLRRLAARGAVAAITVPGAGTFEGAVGFLGRPGLGLAQAPSSASPIPLLVVHPRVAERLFEGSGERFAEAAARAAAGEGVSRQLRTRFTARLRTVGTALTGQNVVAVLRGSDPELAKQAVVYTAHYDAFGRDPAGVVRPGAADNALGVAKLVALAEAYASQANRPRRTIVFLAPTGEEYGNLGTEYWLDHPTWPVSEIAANINFDGIGTDVFGPVKRVTDYGISYSTAGDLVNRVLAERGIALVPDGAPEQGFFQRSDHYSFAKRGVPPVYLIGGAGTEAASRRAGEFFAERYHTPGDTILADWSWSGARDLAMVGYLVGQRLGNEATMPRWAATSPFQHGRGMPLLGDLAAATEARGQHSEVIAAAESMMRAVMRRDSATVDRLLADEFVLTSSETPGPLVTKQQYVGGILDPAYLTVTHFRFHDHRVVSRGAVAIVHSRLEWRSTLRGRPWNADFLNTDVWSRDGGGWRLVSRHTSYPKPDGRIRRG